MLLQILVSGFVLGCVYGLIALGYSLIYKSSGLMNFVQGDVLTLGAFLGYTFAFRAALLGSIDFNGFDCFCFWAFDGKIRDP